jgi:hypothetical protein
LRIAQSNNDHHLSIRRIISTQNKALMYHKLLKKQINKFLNDDLQKNAEIQEFLKHINQSYLSFERDKDIMNHAFSVSEKEFQEVNESLKKESEVRQITIEKLKEVVFQLVDEDHFFDKSEKDDLYKISEFINLQIQKNKGTEENLKTDHKLIQNAISQSPIRCIG